MRHLTCIYHWIIVTMFHCHIIHWQAVCFDQVYCQHFISCRAKNRHDVIKTSKKFSEGHGRSVELVLLLIYTPRYLIFFSYGNCHSTGNRIPTVSSLAWWVHSRQLWLRRCSSLTGSSNCTSTRRMMWPTHNRETSWETDSTRYSHAWSPWRRYRTHLQNKTSSASADGPRDALWAELCYLDLLWIWCAKPQQSATNPQQVNSKSNAYNKSAASKAAFH